jgi:dTDP-glucose pyrophosphorylase
MQAVAELVKEIEHKYGATFFQIEGLTEGSACTALHARKLIYNDTQLMIANSDQIVDFDPIYFINDCKERNLDGSILTFIDKTRDPKWSFARLDKDGLVSMVKEKMPISEFATAGIYLFRRGSYFVDAAIDMMLLQDRVNNEYYTCPTYNHLIKNGLRIGIYNIPAGAMHGLGTPEDLQNYLSL